MDISFHQEFARIIKWDMALVGIIECVCNTFMVDVGELKTFSRPWKNVKDIVKITIKIMVDTLNKWILLVCFFIIIHEASESIKFCSNHSHFIDF